MAQAMGSPGYPTDEKVLRQRIAEDLKNAPDPAASIPGAELRVIPGLGHDLPDALVPVFAGAITAAAKRSRTP